MLGLMVLVITWFANGGWLLWGWRRRRGHILRHFGKFISNDQERVTVDLGQRTGVLGIVYVCSQLAIDCVLSNQSLWSCIIQYKS